MILAERPHRFINHFKQENSNSDKAKGILHLNLFFRYFFHVEVDISEKLLSLTINVFANILVKI